MRQPTASSNKATKQEPKKSATKPTLEEVIQTSFRLPRSRWQRLQQLCIEERSSVQSVIIAALEAEFSKRGLPF